VCGGKDVILTVAQYCINMKCNANKIKAGECLLQAEKHALRANLQQIEVTDKGTARSTGTSKVLGLLHNSYSCNCSAFQCGVVVILPSSGAGDAG
jgi:hypothetical protein